MSVPRGERVTPFFRTSLESTMSKEKDIFEYSIEMLSSISTRLSRHLLRDHALSTIVQSCTRGNFFRSFFYLFSVVVFLILRRLLANMNASHRVRLMHVQLPAASSLVGFCLHFVVVIINSTSSSSSSSSSTHHHHHHHHAAPVDARRLPASLTGRPSEVVVIPSVECDSLRRCPAAASPPAASVSATTYPFPLMNQSKSNQP